MQKFDYKTTCRDAIYAKISHTLTAPHTCARSLPAFRARALAHPLCLPRARRAASLPSRTLAVAIVSCSS
jgi:hypothetical protein